MLATVPMKKVVIPEGQEQVYDSIRPMQMGRHQAAGLGLE